MINNSYERMSGYIEGFYGKLLNWSERRRIIIKLASCEMNTYFYAPKEDICHRLNWRKNYDKIWNYNFKNFCNFSKKKNISVLAGIAPGLNFDFNYENSKSDKNDFNILKKKAMSLLELGASDIVLLLDDIPDHFKNANLDSEGYVHAKLVNRLSKSLNKKIYFVPRIYSNEQIKEKPNYLIDLAKNLNPEIILFYCGKNIVSKAITKANLKSISYNFKNKIVFWDNIYANDYCPRKLYLGKWKDRDEDLNILINPTGMINTDLFLLDIISISKKKNFQYNYKKILKKHQIPIEFSLVYHFFESPHFNSSNSKNINIDNIEKTIISLDYLLWKWKSKLSREWYPYLLILKQDINIQLNKYNNNRILKIQTAPLAKKLLNNT